MNPSRIFRPASNDGRNIDASIAALSGEAAGQAFQAGKLPTPQSAALWHKVPETQANDPAYYDVPMLKKPVWEWAIPLYYYIGGLAGASIAFGAAAQLFGSGHSAWAAKRCRWTGIGGATLGGALLVYDLGRSSRFLNMLRVFRPTSPMNMGAWILAGTVPSTLAVELVCTKRRNPGFLGACLGLASGLFGMGLATYTGVLVGNSAIPIWSESRTLLPMLFGASAVTSAAAAFDISHAGHRYRAVPAFGFVGKASELVLAQMLERKLLDVPRVAIPLHRGKSAFLWKAATALTAASLLVNVLPLAKRKKRIISGVLASLGSVCLRFGIHEAGVPSAKDSRASFRLQHRRLEQRKNVQTLPSSGEPLPLP